MIKVLNLITLLLSFKVYSIALEDLPFEKHENKELKIGIMPGTYDMVHLRHEEIIRNIGPLSGLDYVLVLANDRTLHKPMATDPKVRTKMLYDVFKNDPHVLVVENYDYFGEAITKTTRDFLTERHNNIKFSGIMGADVVNDMKNKIASVVVNVDNWITHSPKKIEDIKFPKQLWGKPVSAYQIPIESGGDPHSSEIRSWFRENKGDFVKPEGMLISDRVFNFIKANHLYEDDVTLKNKAVGFARCMGYLIRSF